MTLVIENFEDLSPKDQRLVIMYLQKKDCLVYPAKESISFSDFIKLLLRIK